MGTSNKLQVCLQGVSERDDILFYYFYLYCFFGQRGREKEREKEKEKLSFMVVMPTFSVFSSVHKEKKNPKKHMAIKGK